MITPTRTITKHGNIEYRVDGKLHRHDGPAIEWTDGTKEWYLYGYRHRDGAPAVIHPEGVTLWYFNGWLHREDGPAVEYANGECHWWFNGMELLDFDEYFRSHTGSEEDKTMLKLQYG